MKLFFCIFIFLCYFVFIKEKSFLFLNKLNNTRLYATLPNLLAYSFPQKQPIFDLNYDYAVVKRISDFWWQDDSLYLEVTLSNLQKSTLKITLYVNGIINLQYYQKKISNNRFDEHLEPLSIKKIDLINHLNYFEIKLLNNEKLLIQKEPFCITLLDCNDTIKFKTNTRKGYEMFESYRTPPLGWKLDKSNEWQPFMSFWLMNDEKIYGLGEKFCFLVKNGIETTIWNSDNSCVANHDLGYNGLPLFYSTKKWGVLVNTGEQTSFEIGSPVTDAISFLSFESCLDLYFFTGQTMKELINQYTDLTGKPTEIPDLSYGIWCNRLYYHNKDELWAEVEKSNRANFPLDVICLDPKWLENRYTKSCNFEYNENAFGSFQELFAQLKAKNIAVCFWINPYLQADNSTNWQIAFKNNYLVKTTDDNSYAHPLTGTETYQTNCGIVDFTNPAAVKWYQDELQKLFNLGLRFIKPDYGDGVPPNAYFSNGLTGKEFRQYYHFLYCKTAYDASAKYFGPNESLTFCRPGYIGTQRFSGKWSGDSYSNFTELKKFI
ncbi:TIM-barrel domain-containing protein [Spiroplasma endosymbiont of Glossina fuscipes fuscipes]